jgi:hypothetical protein
MAHIETWPVKILTGPCKKTEQCGGCFEKVVRKAHSQNDCCDYKEEKKVRSCVFFLLEEENTCEHEISNFVFVEA